MTNNKVLPIIVDGYTFPMHSDYVFDLKKVYTEEPSRTANGSIPVFPSKLFIPYFSITYAFVTIDKYNEMMSKIQSDEVTVQYYDSFSNEYKTAKFYAQQPTISNYLALNGKYVYVKDLQINFAGTLNDISEISINYNANGGSNAPSTIKGYMGEEFKVNSGSGMTYSGYDFVEWNTAPDGSGQTYVPNSIMAFSDNITLYAQWQAKTYYSMSLNYGVGSPTKTESGEDLTSIRVKYNSVIEGLPESVKVYKTSGQEFVDKEGNPVYTFRGWFTLANGEGSSVANGSTYSVQGDSSVYADFNIKSYSLTFNTDGGGSFAPIIAEYGTQISLPKPQKEGVTFNGWYTDSTLQTKFTSSTMPAESLTLYAKYV